MDLQRVGLRLGRYAHGKVSKHSYAHLQVDRSSESNQFDATVALAELRF